MKRILFLAVVLLGNTLLLGQTGRIKINLKEKDNKEVLPFANVCIEDNLKKIVGTGITNINGDCAINILTPGTYTVKATYVGFTPAEISNVKVVAGKTIDVNLEIQAGITIRCIEFVSYLEPLMDVDTISGCSITTECCFGCCSGCYSIDSIVKANNSADDNMKKFPAFNYYPNPTSGQLFVEIKEGVQELFLKDISGKLLQKYTSEGLEKMEIDLSDFASGIYYLNYLCEGKWLTGKVVLVH